MPNHRSVNRRSFLATGAAIGVASLVCRGQAMAAPAGLPSDNPANGLDLAWTDEIKWDQVIDVTKVPGKNWNERVDQAQQAVVEQGSGVVYFPAGTYEFTDSLKVKDGVVLRGADPGRVSKATDKRYSPPTKFEFPKYRPILSGSGSPISTAFKGIHLADAATASNCGVVNVDIIHGHIHFPEAEDHRAGKNRIVFGCRFYASAIADPAVPDRGIGQHAWQRYTQWHFGAINVYAAENILVANNRLPDSSDANFTMKGYVMQGRGQSPTVTYDVVFDYNNRAGIRVQEMCIGAPGGEEPSGTPQSHPWGFRKGFVIRDNYIYSTGRTAIAFTGDGTQCLHNVVRFPKDIWRQTNTGLRATSGSSTNDNRAVQMRGYRWHVEGNDYVVHRNWAADHKYYINDGEGLMHENHCNSHVVDSKLIANRGNTYLSIYKTGGIDGLLIEDNDIRVSHGVAIMADADHSINHRGACRNCSIVNNTTAGGIRIAGNPAANNVVKGNRSLQKDDVIRNIATARVEGNQGYSVEVGFSERELRKKSR